jgi:hypothetical protein
MDTYVDKNMDMDTNTDMDMDMIMDNDSDTGMENVTVRTTFKYSEMLHGPHLT